MAPFQNKKCFTVFVPATCIGFLCGCVIGFVQAVRVILPHAFFQYKMYRISLQYALNEINRSVLLALLAVWSISLAGTGMFRLVQRMSKTDFKKLSGALKRYPTLLLSLAKITFIVWLFINGVFVFLMVFSRPRTPNLIILSVDCLRKDHLSVYGYSRQTSPNMDAFSQDAVLFENVISQSCWTIPSVASLFTLLYPSTHLTRGAVEGFWEENILNPKLVTLAELLKNKGYQTAAFIANHSLIKEYHFDQGFDLYDMIDDSSKPLAENVNKKAFSWLKKRHNKPFFMYVHYMDPHAAYGAPIPYRNFFVSDTKRQLTLEEFNTIKHVLPNANIWDLNTYIDMYDSEIRYVDHHIGELVEFARRKNLFDNTIVVITADHGEAFLEHGFCEHGNALYREEIDIPLIVRFPDKQPFPARVTHRMEQIDVIQSILELMGYGYPYSVHGTSIAECENDTVCFSEEPSLHHKFLPTISMTEHNFKAIYFVPKKTVTDLYDLTSDPLERNNLVRDNTALAEQFRERIKAWATARSADARRLGIDKRPANVHIDKNHINTLKALGYVR